MMYVSVEKYVASFILRPETKMTQFGVQWGRVIFVRRKATKGCKNIKLKI